MCKGLNSYLFAIMLLVIGVHCQSDECIYDNLNLNNLLGETIHCTYYNRGGNFFDFCYTPCADKCSYVREDVEFFKMISQYSTETNLTYDIATFDPNIDYVYNSVQNSYTFIYENGESGEGTSYVCIDDKGQIYNRSINITFVCDPNGDPFNPLNITCGQPDGLLTCYYYLIIPTVDACNITPDICSWTIGNNVLDLNGAKGQRISLIDNENNILYSYTPCSNNLNCLNQNVMAYQANINTLDCENYLSIWDNGVVRPEYNSVDKIWRFEYMNGDNFCDDGLTPIFITYWVCDENAGLIDVQYFNETSECVFSVEIKSELACH